MLLPENAQIILAESGANDPHFNLRRQPVVIQRLTGATNATFVSLLEPHGHYDPDAETVTDSRSRIKALKHSRQGNIDLLAIEWLDGRKVVLALADDPDADASHRIEYEGAPLEWKGHVGRFAGESPYRTGGIDQ
jgi:hypothetical protein